MDQRPKHRTKIIKLSEKKHMGKLHDIGYGNDVSDMTSEALTTIR